MKRERCDKREKEKVSLPLLLAKTSPFFPALGAGAGNPWPRSACRPFPRTLLMSPSCPFPIPSHRGTQAALLKLSHVCHLGVSGLGKAIRVFIKQRDARAGQSTSALLPNACAPVREEKKPKRSSRGDGGRSEGSENARARARAQASLPGVPPRPTDIFPSFRTSTRISSSATSLLWALS